MRAAILGCGYVGTAVARYWRSQGFTVTATTTRPERVGDLQTVADQVQVVQGSDAAAIAALIQPQNTLLICVGAGRQADYTATYLNTAKTVVSVLDQAPALDQILFTSTYSIYGDYGGAWVSETDALRPATENARILAATEAVLLQAASPHRRVCIFRLGGIYGPGRELAKIYRRAAGTTRPGTGQEASNWVHLDDIVGAIAFAQAQGLQGVYNLVQDEIPTLRELIGRVCQAHHLEPVRWDASQPSDRPYNVRVSNQKLKAAGYLFRHGHFDPLP
ncbi:MAG TPA: SDR family oxidoreductase [Leptolyngbyaceae cyanobacterium M65_K2018_010]|nr:SDR family oxidoreductase [Leptolyngbyaceae cyanobacterium M65_K2018_010]